MVGEPFSPTKAKAMIVEIVTTGGGVSFGVHALDEMAKDDLSIVDAKNVLKGGVVQPAEMEKGTWRYRVRTSRMLFVVAFRTARKLAVVTAP